MKSREERGREAADQGLQRIEALEEALTQFVYRRPRYLPLRERVIALLVRGPATVGRQKYDRLTRTEWRQMILEMDEFVDILPVVRRIVQDPPLEEMCDEFADLVAKKEWRQYVNRQVMTAVEKAKLGRIESVDDEMEKAAEYVRKDLGKWRRSFREAFAELAADRGMHWSKEFDQLIDKEPR